MIDEKLRKLLPVKCYKKDLGESCEECDSLIRQIKQVFKEEA